MVVTRKGVHSLPYHQYQQLKRAVDCYPSKRSFTCAREIIRLTNALYTVDFGCGIDLRKLNLSSGHTVYDPSKIVGDVWKHPVIGGCCLVFSSGKLSVVGKESSLADGMIRAHSCTRLIQRKGFLVGVLRLKLVTVLAFFGVS